MKKNMTDEEALKEIDRQEKRFAAAKCGCEEKVKRLATMPVE